MRTAIIHRHKNKVTLYEPGPMAELHPSDIRVIAVTYGNSISITLSEDEDKWLINVYSKDGITTCSVFADCVEKGGY